MVLVLDIMSEITFKMTYTLYILLFRIHQCEMPVGQSVELLVVILSWVILSGCSLLIYYCWLWADLDSLTQCWKWQVGIWNGIPSKDESETYLFVCTDLISSRNIRNHQPEESFLSGNFDHQWFSVIMVMMIDDDATWGQHNESINNIYYVFNL